MDAVGVAYTRDVAAFGIPDVVVRRCMCAIANAHQQRPDASTHTMFVPALGMTVGEFFTVRYFARHRRGSLPRT